MKTLMPLVAALLLAGCGHPLTPVAVRPSAMHAHPSATPGHPVPYDPCHPATRLCGSL